MSTRYLLECECGRTLPVGLRQAGSHLTCPCGKSVNVPALRELKTLPQEAPNAGQSKAKGAGQVWSPLTGGMFALGIPIVLVGLVVFGLSLYTRFQLDTRQPEIDYSKWSEDLQGRPVEDLWDMWRILSDVDQYPLQRDVRYRFVVHRKIARQMESRLLYSAIAVALGAGIIVASYVLRPTARPAGKTRRRRPRANA